MLTVPAVADVCDALFAGQHWNTFHIPIYSFLWFNILLDKVVCSSQTHGIFTSRNNIFHSINNKEPFLRIFRRGSRSGFYKNHHFVHPFTSVCLPRIILSLFCPLVSPLITVTGSLHPYLRSRYFSNLPSYLPFSNSTCESRAHAPYLIIRNPEPTRPVRLTPCCSMHCVHPLHFFRTGSEALIGLVHIMAPKEVLGTINTTSIKLQWFSITANECTGKHVYSYQGNNRFNLKRVAYYPIYFSLRLSRPKLK